MIKLTKISVRNFMSFGNVPQVLDLSQYPITLIQGVNKDKNDDEPDIGIFAVLNGESESSENGLSEKPSNGSGKSTILGALNYAIFGESIANKIKKTNLVNKTNKKNMEVFLDFEKNGTLYRIERGRSPEFLRFFINGEDIAQGENKDTQEEINKVLGMSPDLFYQTCLLTASAQTFMEMNAAGQREIIEQLLGVQILSEKAERLKEKVKEVKQIIATEEVRLQTVKSANEEIIRRNEAQKLDYTNKLNAEEANRTAKINQYNGFKETLLKVDIEKEIQAHKFNQTRLSIIEENNKIISQQNECKGKISQLTVQMQGLVNQVTTLSSINLETEKQAFENNAKIVQNNELIEKEIREVSTHLNDIDRQLIEVTHSIKSIAGESITITSENKRLEETISMYNTEINRIDEDLKKIEQNVCPTCGNKLHNGAEKTAELNQKKDQITKTINESATKKESNVKTLSDLNNRLEVNQKTENTIKESRKVIENQIAELRKKIVNDFQKTYYKDIKEVFEHQNKVNVLNTSIEELKKQITEANNVLTSLVQKPVSEVMTTFYPDLDKALVHAETLANLDKSIEEEKNKVNPYVELLKQCETVKLMPYDETLKKSNEVDLTHLEFLVKLLTNKDSFVRKKIVEQNLSYLNQKIKSYLSSMGSLHTVIFNSDLSFDITRFGEAFDFAGLSRGEKTSVILALNFAFRDLYELINEPINVMFVDELIDNGLDKFTASNVVNILQKYSESGKNVFVVSHRKDIQARMNRILTVVMELGFSEIKGE